MPIEQLRLPVRLILVKVEVDAAKAEVRQAELDDVAYVENAQRKSSDIGRCKVSAVSGFLVFKEYRGGDGNGLRTSGRPSWGISMLASWAASPFSCATWMAARTRPGYR